MISDEDIKKILICREAIDKHRVFKTQFRSKIESAENKDKTKEELEPHRTESTLARNAVLKEQGFDDYHAFKEWNDKVCFETFKEFYPLSGFCDYCGEQELKEQNCIKTYGLTDCTSRKNGGGLDWGAWSEAYRGFKEDTNRVIKDRYYGLCPDGHGFYVVIADIKEPPFDIFWK